MKDENKQVEISSGLVLAILQMTDAEWQGLSKYRQEEMIVERVAEHWRYVHEASVQHSMVQELVKVLYQIAQAEDEGPKVDAGLKVTYGWGSRRRGDRRSYTGTVQRVFYPRNLKQHPRVLVSVEGEAKGRWLDRPEVTPVETEEQVAARLMAKAEDQALNPFLTDRRMRNIEDGYGNTDRSRLLERCEKHGIDTSALVAAGF